MKIKKLSSLKVKNNWFGIEFDGNDAIDIMLNCECWLLFEYTINDDVIKTKETIENAMQKSKIYCDYCYNSYKEWKSMGLIK